MQMDMKDHYVLAWFSRFKAGGIMLVGWAMVIGLYAVPFFTSSGNPIQYLGDHSRWAGLIILAWFASLYWFRLMFAMSKQLFLKGRAAIWLEDDYLIYLRPQDRTEVHDIAKLSLDRFKSYGVTKRVVTITRRDGTVQLLPMSLLSESAEIVFARLKTLTSTSAGSN